MKKILLSILLGASSLSAFSQSEDKVTRVSLVFSPNLIFNGTNSSEVNKNITPNEKYKTSGIGVRFRTGIMIDKHFSPNACFTTGMYYLTKRAEFEVERANLTLTNETYKYNVQYLQVPLNLKMYTNNIADDFKLYFLLGPNLDFKIKEKHVSGDLSSYEDKKMFLFFDAALQAGTGVDWQLGSTTSAFFGISYNRGLLNNINPLLKYKGSDLKLADYLTLKSQFISLDMGIKF